MGIGLSISKRIIESHGGELTVHRNKHGGATFTFTLPILTEASVEYN
jgi:two-component system, LuxR family, sensor kinase FixL